MSRLPVGPDNNSDAAPLTVRVSWAALAVVAALGLIWFFGIDLLRDWLSLDGECVTEPGLGRRARYAELVGCSLAAGPRGWLWLAWCASFPAFITIALERKLRRSVLARGQAAREGKDIPPG